MSNPTNEVKYFDLHTTGLGYLNDFRQVRPNQGKPYYAVRIAALRGNSNNTSYTYYDCSIPSEEALNVLLNFVDNNDDEKGQKVRFMATFKIGDTYPDPFIYQKGEKQGQPGVALKSRLLQIRSLYRNGELVYKRKVDEQDTLTAQDMKQANHHETVQSSSSVKHSDETQQTVNEAKFLEVFLSKEDPEFDSKKESLKHQGYRWNSERQSWQLPIAA